MGDSWVTSLMSEPGFDFPWDILVAVAAFLLAYLVYRHSVKVNKLTQKHLKKESKRQRKHDQLIVQPHLEPRPNLNIPEGKYRLDIHNEGLGPAIVTEVNFYQLIEGTKALQIDDIIIWLNDHGAVDPKVTTLGDESFVGPGKHKNLIDTPINMTRERAIIFAEKFCVSVKSHDVYGNESNVLSRVYPNFSTRIDTLYKDYFKS